MNWILHGIGIISYEISDIFFSPQNGGDDDAMLPVAFVFQFFLEVFGL